MYNIGPKCALVLGGVFGCSKSSLTMSTKGWKLPGVWKQQQQLVYPWKGLYSHSLNAGSVSMSRSVTSLIPLKSLSALSRSSEVGLSEWECTKFRVLAPDKRISETQWALAQGFQTSAY